MGTFQRIRQISPYVFGFFALMLVLFFTIGDDTVMQGLFSGSRNPQARPIGIINEEELSFSQFDENVKKAIENQKQQSKEKEITIDELQVRKQVWDQMVDELLLKQQANYSGISVSDDLLREELMTNPPQFIRQQLTDSSGRFMSQIYYDVVTNPDNYVNYLGVDPNQLTPEQRQEAIGRWRTQLLQIQDYIRAQTLQTNLQALVNTATGIISPAYAKQRYLMDSATASANYIAFRIDPVEINKIKVSDNEIREYYESHKQYYKQNDQRKLKYVFFPIQASKQDSLKAQRRLNILMTELSAAATPEAKDSVFSTKVAEFNGSNYEYSLIKDIDPQKMAYLSTMQKGQVLGPVALGSAIYYFRLDDRRTGGSETVKARHILIKSDQNKDSALAKANDILKQIRGGKSFEEMATQYSEDPGSAQKGGDLGYFGRGQMVKPFEDAAFGADSGQIVGPVESDFGYHLIKVEDKASVEIKYSEIGISPSVSPFTKKNTRRMAFDFVNSVREEEKDFNKLAKQMNLPTNESAFFERQMPIMQSQYLTSLAFKAEKGEVLDPVEINGIGYVVAKVTDVREKGTKVLEDTKPEIQRKLQTKKALDKLESQAKNVYNKVKGLGDLQQAINVAQGVTVSTLTGIKNNGVVQGGGSDMGLTAAVFNGKVGQISKPVRGENGYYIVQTTSKNVPNENQVKNELPAYVKTLSQQNAQNGFYMWYNQLKRDAKIEDNRYNFFSDF